LSSISPAFEIYDQLDFGGLLDWQVRWLLALKDTAGVDSCVAIRFRKAAAVADQAAGGGELAILINRGHRVAERECAKLPVAASEEEFAEAMKKTGKA
jgi:hypothetical protein